MFKGSEALNHRQPLGFRRTFQEVKIPDFIRKWDFGEFLFRACVSGNFDATLPSPIIVCNNF